MARGWSTESKQQVAKKVPVPHISIVTGCEINFPNDFQLRHVYTPRQDGFVIAPRLSHFCTYNGNYFTVKLETPS